MNKEKFDLVESYMLQCMEDSAHDKEHVYRVLYNALRIAAGEDADINNGLKGSVVISRGDSDAARPKNEDESKSETDE